MLTENHFYKLKLHDLKGVIAILLSVDMFIYPNVLCFEYVQLMFTMLFLQ